MVVCLFFLWGSITLHFRSAIMASSANFCSVYSSVMNPGTTMYAAARFPPFAMVRRLACYIYHLIAGVTGPIYDCNHCRTGDIAKTQVMHITKAHHRTRTCSPLCSIYDGIARVTGPIYDYNHCRTGDIAKTQVRHTTKGTGQHLLECRLPVLGVDVEGSKGGPGDVGTAVACGIYRLMARVTGPIYDSNHCRTVDIAKLKS